MAVSCQPAGRKMWQGRPGLAARARAPLPHLSCGTLQTQTLVNVVFSSCSGCFQSQTGWVKNTDAPSAFPGAVFRKPPISKAEWCHKKQPPRRTTRGVLFWGTRFSRAPPPTQTLKHSNPQTLSQFCQFCKFCLKTEHSSTQTLSID